MVRDRVLNDLQELLLGRGRLDGETVKELDHETGESLEGTWDTDGGADFDEDSFGGVDVDLQLASLVDWRVKKRKEALGQSQQKLANR